MNKIPDPLPSLLPLREPTFFILLSLAPDSARDHAHKHGYAIMQEVEALSGGRLQLSTGTLYEGLARLLEQRLIERVEDVSQTQESASPRPGKPRKVYRLTGLGQRVLEAETHRLKSLLAAAQGRLGAQAR